MANLHNAVLATLAYYDLMDFPLTLIETHRHLINPARLQMLSSGTDVITLADTAGELDFLVRTGRAHERNGYYMLSRERSDLYDLRMEREKLASGKWKKLLKAARWFQAVPYVRALFVSGSLALNNSGEQGDFDILTVGKAGRLYTCRLLLSLTASLLGMRRTRHDAVAPDKFCFNHYVSEAGLAIKHQSLFTAQAYAALIPILAKGPIVESFYMRNGWINKYAFHFTPDRTFIRRNLPIGGFLEKIAMLGERVLDTSFGDGLERLARRYQQARIMRNPVTYEPGGRVVCADDELEFHPKSFEAELIARYNDRLKKLGIQQPKPETDSGLTA